MITKIISSTPQAIVSLAEAKSHSRIDDGDDVEVQAKLDAAHDLVQQWLNRKLWTTTVAGIEEIYKPEFILPFSPVQAITEITARNESNVVQTIPTADYWLDDVTDSVKFVNPQTGLQNFKITYTCGYANTADVPLAIKHAILMTFATLYEYREDSISGTQINDVPVSARNIIKSFRLRSTR